MADRKLVIFDFDGVLVNTGHFWFARMKDLNGHITWERFSELSEGSFIDKLAESVESKELVYDYKDRTPYVEHLGLVSIHDALHKCVLDLARSFKLCIVSSAYTSEIAGFLAKEGLQECFSDVLGCDVDTNKTRKLQSLLEKYSVDPAKTVYVTDTLGDVREAFAAGVSAIGVTWGLHTAETFGKGNPYAVVDTVPELEAAVERFFVI